MTVITQEGKGGAGWFGFQKAGPSTWDGTQNPGPDTCFFMCFCLGIVHSVEGSFGYLVCFIAWYFLLCIPMIPLRLDSKKNKNKPASGSEDQESYPTLGRKEKDNREATLTPL